MQRVLLLPVMGLGRVLPQALQRRLRVDGRGGRLPLRALPDGDGRLPEPRLGRGVSVQNVSVEGEAFLELGQVLAAVKRPGGLAAEVGHLLQARSAVVRLARVVKRSRSATLVKK